jgi:hypothetical protein
MPTPFRHRAHLGGQFPERSPGLLCQDLAEDVAMLGFRGSAILGRSFFELDDELLFEIAYNELGHKESECNAIIAI